MRVYLKNLFPNFLFYEYHYRRGHCYWSGSFNASFCYWAYWFKAVESIARQPELPLNQLNMILAAAFWKS